MPGTVPGVGGGEAGSCCHDKSRLASEQAVASAFCGAVCAAKGPAGGLWGGQLGPPSCLVSLAEGEECLVQPVGTVSWVECVLFRCGPTSVDGGKVLGLLFPALASSCVFPAAPSGAAPR